MKKTITGLLILIPALCFAQQKTVIGYTNITEAGVLHGKSQTAFNVQTINGITFNQTSIGLGVGLDNYGYKSIPVFIDVRQKLGRGACKLLVYVDAGLNVPVRNNDLLPAKWDDGNEAYRLHTNFYGEAGIGINNKINRKLSLHLTAGFSYKHFSYTEHSQIWYSMPYLFSSRNATYGYYYRRLSVRLGLQF